MVNKWFVQCTWEKINTATTNKEAAEELTNCIQMQMLLTSDYRVPQKINYDLAEAFCGFGVRELVAFPQWQLGSKEKFKQKFSLEGRQAGTEAAWLTLQLNIFFLFFFWVGVRRYLFRKLGAEKVAGLKQIKKKLSTCTDKRKLNAQQMGLFVPFPCVRWKRQKCSNPYNVHSGVSKEQHHGSCEGDGKREGAKVSLGRKMLKFQYLGSHCGKKKGEREKRPLRDLFLHGMFMWQDTHPHR